MSDVLLSLCGKIERSFRRGKKVYKLTVRENEIMKRNSREIISMLRDFDAIESSYDESRSEVEFK